MTVSPYQPSSSEKKTVILIYLLIGIIMILQKDRIHSRVLGHMHQALGRWVCFVILSMASIILVFIPLLSLMPLFVLVIVTGIRGWFVYESRSGLPARDEGGLGIFLSIGKRMTDVMDIHPILKDEVIEDIGTDVS